MVRVSPKFPFQYEFLVPTEVISVSFQTPTHHLDTVTYSGISGNTGKMIVMFLLTYNFDLYYDTHQQLRFRFHFHQEIFSPSRYNNRPLLSMSVRVTLSWT